ncbi:hypothetical protein Ddc_06498 [Ditylenchus destructor]|nr:hypothetical protein Ddc_06498 [Ditylenchus destructor]
MSYEEIHSCFWIYGLLCNIQVRLAKIGVVRRLMSSKSRSNFTQADLGGVQTRKLGGTQLSDGDARRLLALDRCGRCPFVPINTIIHSRREQGQRGGSDDWGGRTV